MALKSFDDYIRQYNKTDLAFFELMRSVAEIHEYENELSRLEIEQVQISARILNGIILRNKSLLNQVA